MKKTIILSMKVLFIVLVFGFLYWTNRQEIHGIVNQTELSQVEKGLQITRQILGANYQDINNHSTGQKIGTENATSTTPRTLTNEVKVSENYQHAEQVALNFNQQMDTELLNQHFTELINQARGMSGWSTLEIGYHLADGVERRITELSDYHYLGAKTVADQDFRSLFHLENAVSRLGENLYELYIAADNIHLQTWLNTEIFAEYLFKAFESSTQAELYQNFSSQYVKVVASPTDYRVDNTAYVRLVVVLVMDTQNA